MNIKISKKFLTVDGQRVGIWITTGPWVEGVDPATIKIRPKKHRFPRAFRDAVAIENNSDARADYFEADCIRLVPGHPLYEAAAKVAGL